MDSELGLWGVHLVPLLYIQLKYFANCIHFWSRGLESLELFSLLEIAEKGPKASDIRPLAEIVGRVPRVLKGRGAF